MNSFTKIGIVFFIIVMCVPSNNIFAQNHPGLSLKETFDLYVKSVQQADLKSLFSTVTNHETMYFVTADGKLIDTRTGYYQFHEDWFKESNWEMPVDIVKVQEGMEYGYVIAIFHYKSKAPEGEIYNLDSYFTLIFHKEEGMWKVIADLCSPIDRFIRQEDTDITYNMDQIYFFNMITNRRTVRKFKSDPVPKEHVLKILDAARFAPTAGNQQPWKFLVIQNREKLEQLKDKSLEWYMDGMKNRDELNESRLKQMRERLRRVLTNVLSAPVYVAVLVDATAKYPEYVIMDGTLAAGNLMNAARALGYGTGFFTTFFPEKQMKTFLKIPEQYKLICFTPIGIPEEWPQTPQKKALKDVVVFEEF